MTTVINTTVSAAETARVEDASSAAQGSPTPDQTETALVRLCDPLVVERLLIDVIVFLRRYVVITDAQAVAIVLWVAHTHAFEAADCTPYLQLTSATKRAGKTRLLEVLEPLVARPWFTGRTSAAALVRKVDAECPTLLLDESDAAFGGEKEYTEALRGLLNTGYRRSGKSTICTGLQARDFSTFSPKAIAGIGQLPGTIADRAIKIHLRRRTTDEPCARWREREGHQQAAPLHQRLALWAAPAIDILRVAQPALPESLGDRQADVWEPLLAIADLAGGTWPSRARSAAIALAGSVEDTDITVELLKDVAAILQEIPANKDIIASAVFIEKLTELKDRRWATYRKNDRPMTPRGLARLLDPLGIHVDRYCVDGEKVRGYRRDAFDDAIARYLPVHVATRPNPNEHGPESPNLMWSAEAAGATCESQQDPTNTGSGPHGHIDPRGTGPAKWVVATVAPSTVVAAAEGLEPAVSPATELAAVPRTVTLGGRADHQDWTERWRPATIADCILPHHPKTTFQAMVDSATVMNITLAGPAGCGKTSVVRALCEQTGAIPYFLNASEENGIDVLRDKIRPFATTAPLFDQRKFVIFDEADSLTIPAQNALKGLTEEFALHCGFLFTTNDATKIIEPLKSRCPVIDFDFTADERELLPLMIARAELILRSERVEFDPNVVAQVVKRHYPDFRAVLNALQRASLRGRLDPDALRLQS